MSSSDFVKGACRQCGGHLEFPASAAGTTITCPHCGWPTELESPLLPPKPAEKPPRTPGMGGLWLGVIVGVVVIAAGLAGGFFYWQKTNQANGSSSKPPPAIVSNTPTVLAPPKPPTPKSKPQIETNDFAIMPFKLDKTAGSSLVYVTGTVENTSDRQRFGVKVSFGLFDDNDNPVGLATDYQSLIEPHAEWHFKALVMESKATSAKFNSVAEQQ